MASSSGRRHWTYPHRHPGRPALAAETVELICQLARENPRWGYLRIVGEVRKLGITVSKTTVAAVLHRHGLPPAPRRDSPSWSELAPIRTPRSASSTSLMKPSLPALWIQPRAESGI